MESEFYNTPSLSYKVDGKIWLSTREIKDVDGNIVYTIPKSSLIINNTIYILRGVFELIKVILGSELIILLFKGLS